MSAKTRRHIGKVALIEISCKRFGAHITVAAAVATAQ